MLFQSVATNSRPNPLWVKIDSDITRIGAGRWDPSQSHGRERNRKSGGGVGGENKRVRGPVSEWEKERACGHEKKRVKTGRKKEIESHHGAQEIPVLRKGERTTETERTREIEIKTTETQDARKRKRQRVQCDTCCTHKYSVYRGYRTPLISRPDSTPSQCLSVRKPNTFQVGDNYRGNVPVVSHL